jgi:hypothetical protein
MPKKTSKKWESNYNFTYKQKIKNYDRETLLERINTQDKYLSFAFIAILLLALGSLVLLVSFVETAEPCSINEDGLELIASNLCYQNYGEKLSYMRVYDDHVLIFCDTNHLTIWKE